MILKIQLVIFYIIAIVFALGAFVLLLLEVVPIMDYSLTLLISDDPSTILIGRAVFITYILLLMGVSEAQNRFDTKQITLTWQQYLQQNRIHIQELWDIYEEYDRSLILGLTSAVYVSRLIAPAATIDIVHDIIEIDSQETNSASNLTMGQFTKTEESYPLLNTFVGLFILIVTVGTGFIFLPQFLQIPQSVDPWDYVIYFL